MMLSRLRSNPPGVNENNSHSLSGRFMPRIARLAAFAVLSLGLFLARGAAAEPAPAQTIWRLTDYVAVDYAGAVADGKVLIDSEYAEQNEFVATIREKIGELPPTPAKEDLQRQSAVLVAAVAAKADPRQVANLAHMLGAALLAAYPVPLAPKTAPDLARGASLYRETCMGCHGATGGGDGPAAASLQTKPVAFADRTRARERSPFGLAQVIEQGLEGTAMPSFANLSADDRWALAFTIGNFAFTPGEAHEGETLWKDREDLRKLVPDLETLTQTSLSALSQKIGEKDALPLLAYLRANPGAVVPRNGASLALARDHIAAAVTAYEAGAFKPAEEEALAAYLDGFEPVEPLLKAHDAALMSEIEGAMGEFRSMIGKHAPLDEIKARQTAIAGMLDKAGIALSSDNASDAANFTGAFTILFREGLEALLIVVAMIAFLRKAERPEVLRYVHMGWTVALFAGFLTWVAATYLVSFSGASRELTEGAGSLLAAIVLLSVGIWMHGKAQAGAWQLYIEEKLSHALSQKSAWFLFVLSFVVVYREVFETILFYMALWAEGSHGAVIAGAGAGAVALVAIGWVMLRWSRELSIGKFFSWSSLLMALLAVVLVGKGVKGLQEAGLIDVRTLNSAPSFDLLGLFPTVQTVAGQGLMILALAAGFAWNRRTRNLTP